MTQPNPEDNPGPSSAAGSANEPPKIKPVRYDLGRLLQEEPCRYRITELCVANLGYLRLALQARVAFRPQGHFYQYILIDCVNAVDYSIRPSHPALIEGGPCLEYHEQHELLDTVSHVVPNTDGMEHFPPSLKFALLIIDQTHIIAERFEMTILTDGVTTTIGWSPAEKERQMELLKRALDSIDKYRLGRKK